MRSAVALFLISGGLFLLAGCGDADGTGPDIRQTVLCEKDKSIVNTTTVTASCDKSTKDNHSITTPAEEEAE